MRESLTDVVTVLIADDEEDMRILLRVVLLDANPYIDVVAEATTGDEVIAELERLEATPPSVLVLDHRMPGLTGLDVAERVLARSPEQPIVLFSAFLTPALRERARRVGIRRCLTKDELAQVPDVVTELAR